MPLPSIPIQLSPDEIRHQETAFESTWTPGETDGKFQEWTRFWIRQDAEVTKQDIASTLEVHVRPCVRDTQWKLNPMKKKFGETFGEFYAPLDGSNSEVEVLAATPSNLDAVLVWSQEDRYELDEESVAKLFPDNVGIERQGTAWVVYEKMLTDEERMAQSMKAEVQRGNPQKEKEQALDREIASLKIGFYAFEHKLLGNMQPSDSRYASLKEPFDIMRRNEGNPHANFAVVERLAKQSGLPLPVFTLGNLKDRQHFSYGPMPENTTQGHMLYAGFAPTHQLIAFRSLTDQNDLDNLVMHHELRHVRHFAHRRAQLGDEQYFKLIFANPDKPYVFIEDELEAYGQEMEALNVLINGRLATNKSASYNEMCDVLQTRSNQQTPMQFLALMSDAYFAPKQDTENYAPEFRDFITQTQLHDGYEILTMRSNQICKV